MVVSEIAPQTAFPGDTVAVDVSTAFRDPDGDALTFTAVASDSSVVGVSVSESHVTMVGLSRGSAVVTVTARDPHGAEAGQSFEVTVPNRGPAVAEAIGPRTVLPTGAGGASARAPWWTCPGRSAIRMATH